MLKKLLFVLLIAAVTAGGVFAQQAGTFSIGARLGPSFGFHNPTDAVKKAQEEFGGMVSLNDTGLVNFNFALYGAYTLIDNLSLAAEFNFHINQGYKITGSMAIPFLGSMSLEGKGYYSSLDIPILVKYNFLKDPAVFGVLAGPHLSFPLGKAEIEYEASMMGLSEAGSEKYDMEGITVGLTIGVFGGYKVGPGRFIGDLRFIFDFNSSQIKDTYIINGVSIKQKEDAMKRRALALTLGYEISF